MRALPFLSLLTALFASPALAAPGDAPPVTTASLITQMSDLESLTRRPAPGTRVVQFSSYDRRSRVPGGPDWFGNSDGFGGEPIPGFESVAKAPGADGVGEYVICDVSQPGAIVRTWTAAIEGTLRVTLDGSSTPLYEGPAQDFFMHHASALATSAGLSTDDAFKKSIPAFEQRYADYYPIPFARSCRIVWIGKLDQVHFYHVQLKLFPAGTPVTTFSPADVKTSLPQAQLAAKNMLPGAQPSAPGDTTPLQHAEAIDAGDTREMFKFESGGAIRQLEATVSASDIPAALRGLLLKISFDGHQAPQIVCPLGDFFGAAPGLVPMNTLPASIRPDGAMVLRLVMPFEKSAVVTLENHSPVRAQVSLTAHHGPYEWDASSMHLRARWRVDHDLTARGSANAVDLPFLSAHGAGVYVGTAVYLMSPCPVPTAGGNWWGEGDEKIFVDGEARPSIFGTGSEDYFNYAWSEADIFEYPYFSQPICTGPETRGYITNNRWHILDAIPFDHSIDFLMELFAHTPTPHLSYARLSYWYGLPGAHDDSVGVNISDLRVPALLPWTVRAAGGAANASIFEAEAARDPEKPAAIINDVRYSAGALARFPAPSAPLHITLPKAGKYQVVFTAAEGEQPLTFKASIAGKPFTAAGDATLRLTAQPFIRLINLRTDPLDLPAGPITIELTDITDPSGEGLGLDFIWLRPINP